MDDNIREYIEQVKEKTLKVINPDRIILFGSYARGDYSIDSDIDLLFIVNEGGLRSVKHKIDNLLQDRKFPMDILVYSEDEFRDKKDIIGTIPYIIEKEGELIYDKERKSQRVN